MKHLSILILVFVHWSCHGQLPGKAQNSPDNPVMNSARLSRAEIDALDSADINFQFRGNCYAYSSPKNAVPSNGEAHSDNLPVTVGSTFTEKGFYLVIRQNEMSKIDSSILGCKLYLVNATKSVKTLEASDSRLYIVAEALNENNEWTTISFLPASDCGNSYHTVILDKNEYWSFDIPVFKGSVKTRLRYTLTQGKDKKISSNEIVAYLNKGQFNVQNKEGHRAVNLMDPYTH